MTNARDFLMYKLDVSKLYPLHQIKADTGMLSDLLVHDQYNTGVLLVKVNSNSVACRFSGKIQAFEEDLLSPKCSIVLLDSQRTIEDLSINEFACADITDKRLAIIIQYKILPLQDFSKKPIGSITIEACFDKAGNSVSKKAESTMTLSQPQALSFSYTTLSGIYGLDIFNDLGADIAVQDISIAGQNQISSMELCDKEQYSASFDNSSGKVKDAVLELSYTLPKERIAV
jgi:hypothetical protein